MKRRQPDKRLFLASTAPGVTIATRTPGTMRLRASMTWDAGEKPSRPPLLKQLSGLRLSEVFEGEEYAVEAEITAFCERKLQGLVDEALGLLCGYAGATGAVFLSRCERVGWAHTADGQTIGELARLLCEAGEQVRVGPVRLTLPEDGILVSCDGQRRKLLTVLEGRGWDCTLLETEPPYCAGPSY